jgi:CBS domain-containing protein
MNVRECMSADLRMTSPQGTIREAARMMREADTGAIPVGENDRLVGMITDRDIAVRAVAEGKGSDTPVREVMTGEINHCLDDEDLDSVALKMGDMKVCRLPVLNRDKRLVGMVSLGDLSQQDGDGSRGAAALCGVSQPGGPRTHA